MRINNSTKQWISTLENMVNEIIGHAKYRVRKYGNKYAIGVYDTQENCLRLWKEKLLLKETQCYLEGILEGLTKGDI